MSFKFKQFKTKGRNPMCDTKLLNANSQSSIARLNHTCIGVICILIKSYNLFRAN